VTDPGLPAERRERSAPTRPGCSSASSSSRSRSASRGAATSHRGSAGDGAGAALVAGLAPRQRAGGVAADRRVRRPAV